MSFLIMESSFDKLFYIFDEEVSDESKRWKKEISYMGKKSKEKLCRLILESKEYKW